MTLCRCRWILLAAMPLLAANLSEAQFPPGDAIVSVVPALPLNPTLGDYIQIAEIHNPSLKAAFNRWQSALQKIIQARSLEDPTLSYMEYLEKNMETQREMGIMQMFPYPGKRSLMGEIEAAEAESLRRELEKERLRLRAEVSDAFYELCYLEQAIRINEENCQLLKHFEEVATASYGVGRSGSSDVIKAQVELGKLDNQLQSLRESRAPLHARLNALLNRPTSLALPAPGEVLIQEPPADAQPLVAQAMRINPEIQALDSRILKSMRQTALAQKQRYPDFSFGLNWMDSNSRMEESMGDEYAASLEMNLPVYRKRVEAGVQEAEQALREARNMQQDARNRISVEIQSTLYKARNARRQIALLQEALIPKARQNLELTESAYSAGRAAFLEILDAERELLMFQENCHRSIADLMQALAALEPLVGGPLKTTPTVSDDAMAPEEIPPAEAIPNPSQGAGAKP